jgi:hypothetical protein
MATITVQPTGVSTPDDWDNALVGNSKHEACQTPDDDETSYLDSPATSGVIQTFTTTPSGIAIGDIVTRVDVIARWRQPATNPPSGRMGYSFVISGGGTQTGASSTISGIGTSYQTDTYTHSGLSVAWEGSLKIFVETMLHRRIRLTSFTAVITYTPSGLKSWPYLSRIYGT